MEEDFEKKLEKIIGELDTRLKEIQALRINLMNQYELALDVEKQEVQLTLPLIEENQVDEVQLELPLN